MMSRRLFAFVSLMTLSLTNLVLVTGRAEAAQTVYRCGTTYSYIGCANGVAVNGTQPVSASDRKEAERVAARQRRLGLDMEGDRRRQEASVRPMKAGSFKAAVAAHPAASTPRKPTAKKRRPGRDVNIANTDEPPSFTASVPPAVKKK